MSPLPIVIGNNGRLSTSPPSELKIVLLGAAGVGRSALALQFVPGHFPLAYGPTVEDSYRWVLEIPSACLGLASSNDTSAATSSLVLELMDTAGTEQFAGMRNLYVRRGNAFLFAYALHSQVSLQAARATHEQTVR